MSVSIHSPGTKTLRVCGLMSGTSADGIDAAIVDVGPRRVKLLAYATFPYPPRVRADLLEIFDAGRVDDICHYNFVLGELLADAVIRLARRSHIPLNSIDMVGSHGQTIHHLPRGRRLGKRLIRSTLQIGEPCVIAERTGITTVADFRTRDVAAGGQGAPLVPYADFFLFAHARKTRAVQNIGGIANVTLLPAGGGIDRVFAFDTGPGNMIMDRLASRVTHGRAACDIDGLLARRGKVHAALLAELMRHPYLRRKPPKTTGREMFGRRFADALFDRARTLRLDRFDLLATATAFTAASIADAYRRFLPPVDEVILCGGGSRNPTLVDMLRLALPAADVKVMDALGLDADAKEAVSFAILAAETIRRQASNVPLATGARRAVILGKIVPGNRQISMR